MQTSSQLVAVSLLVLPSTSSAQAIIERFTDPPVSVGPELVDDTCAGPGIQGVLTGTFTSSGQVLDTTHTRHFVGTTTFVYRVDFADGSYLLASQHEPFTFNQNRLNDQLNFGGTLLERGTLYDASGTVLGHEMFHARFRTNIVDGAVVVEFDEGFVTCR